LIQKQGDRWILELSSSPNIGEVFAMGRV
jgi:hypothetical protein